ncbi:hypothetical protein PUN28_006254 [Cardiocondyla obscurior]|uniref:Uncharacterized protein n=1 Tax=Cardiocondyla obscurior TaxID=286306 RepID=A0AAW2G7S2_9HYME
MCARERTCETGTSGSGATSMSVQYDEGGFGGRAASHASLFPSKPLRSKSSRIS